MNGPRRLPLLFATSVVALIAGYACLPQPQIRGETVAATFAGGRITCADLEDVTRGRRGKVGGERQRIETAAVTRALALAAEVSGLTSEPAVDQQLRAAEDTALATAVRDNERAKASISDAEVEAALEAERAHLERPKKVQVQNIFKRVPAGAGETQIEAVRRAVETLRARALTGEDFSALAEAESDSQTAARGGRMGMAKAGQLPPAIDALVFELPEGGVTEVVELPDGFAFFRAAHIIEARTLDIDEVRKTLRQNLLQRDGYRLVANLEQRLRLEAETSFNLEALRRADAPGDAVVVSYGSSTLSAEQVRAFAGPLPDPIPDAVLERLHGRLESQVTKILLAEYARTIDLKLDSEAARRLEVKHIATLANAELERRMRNNPLQSPNEEELRRFYDARAHRYNQAPTFDLGVIRLTPAGGHDTETAALARTLRAKLVSGRTTFASAAATHSDLPSASRGGRAGWLPGTVIHSRFGADVLRAAQALAPGEISQVVNDEGALWIITLYGSKDRRQPAFDEVAEQVARDWAKQHSRTLEKQIRQEVLESINLKIVGACSDEESDGNGADSTRRRPGKPCATQQD